MSLVGSGAGGSLGGLGASPVTVLSAPGSEVVSLCVAVRHGSREDPDDLPGLAHLLEHLASPAAGSGAVIAAGGRRNAVTLGELTLFSATLPRTDDVLTIVADEISRIGSVNPEREDIDREAAVIALEAASAPASPLAKLLWSWLPARAFDRDPAVVDGMGDPERLAVADLGRVRAALQHRYRSSDTSAVVVGDLEATSEAGLALTPTQASIPGRPLAVRVSAPGRVRLAAVLPLAPAAHNPRSYLSALVLTRLLRSLGRDHYAIFVGHEGRWWASRHAELATVAGFGERPLEHLRRDLEVEWTDSRVAEACAAVALDLGRSAESTALRAQQAATWDALVGHDGPERELVVQGGPRRSGAVADLVGAAELRAVAARWLEHLDCLTLVDEMPA